MFRFVEMKKATFVAEHGTSAALLEKGSPSGGAQDLIIVPFICLLNSRIKER